MANIKQLEQNTPLTPAPENDTVPSAQATTLPSRSLDPAQLRQFVQLLSQQQGQLPPEQVEKLQPLLRQLTPLLDAPKDELAAQPTTNPAQASGTSTTQSLQQLVQRILPMLPGTDPLLRQTIAYGERGNIPLAQLQQQPQILQELLAGLPPMLQESSASGRALNQWLLQLVTLRAPPLTPKSSGNQSLKTQLQQLQITLPSEALLNDKRGQAQIQLLTRETLQLLARAVLPDTKTADPVGNSRPIADSLTPTTGDKLSTATRPSQPDSTIDSHETPSKTTTAGELKEKITTALTRIAPGWLTGKQSSGASTPNTGTTPTASSAATTLPPAVMAKASQPVNAISATGSATIGEKGQSGDEPVASSEQPEQHPIASNTAPPPQAGKLTRPLSSHLTAADSKTEFGRSPQPTNGIAAKQLSTDAADSARVSAESTMHDVPAKVNLLVDSSEFARKAISQPLGEFTHQLNQQVAHSSLPSPLRPLLLQLSTLLQQPPTSELAVREWIQFLRMPMSDTSPMGRAMRQWGVTLLAIRFGLQGKLDESQQQQLGQQLGLPLQNLLGDETLQGLGKMTGHFLAQVERLQQHADPQQPLPNYIPLPPQHPDGREGSLGWQRSPGKHNAYQWSINFYLEPTGLGAVQVRACLDIPDLQLQVTAEKLATVDRIKQTLPQLESRFRELGLTPTAMGCRQGKITPPPQTTTTSDGDGLSIHI